MNNINPFNTKLFNDIYEDSASFLSDYADNGFPTTIQTETATILYYLLYKEFGNSPISNLDENQFKYKLFGTIWQYGPAWEKELSIQTSLRSLTEAELQSGNKEINNHAYNPSQAPSTGALEEINYINDQSTSNQKRGKLEAYALLMTQIKSDVTDAFIKRFRPLFKQFVFPEFPILYESED